MARTAVLSGVYNIMATPFSDDGSLDLASLRNLTDFQIGAGVAGLTVLGIMGEAHKLRDDERLLVIRTVVEQAAGRAPVVAGVSATGTDTAIWLAREAAASGAAGVM